MLKTGNELITEASGLSSVMKEQIVAPVQGMMANAEYLMNQITAVQSYTVELAKTAATAKYRAAVENLFDFRTAPLYNRESIAFKRL